MSSPLESLEPSLLWQHFDFIRQIPRPSKHEEKIIDGIKDWAADTRTATPADHGTREHPRYGTPPAVARLADQGLLFASSEMASRSGGLIEGALEASEKVFLRLTGENF